MTENMEKMWRKYEEIWKNMKDRRTWKNSRPSSRGGEKSYADADTIPGIVPSTEREGGSPAKNGQQLEFYLIKKVYN